MDKIISNAAHQYPCTYDKSDKIHKKTDCIKRVDPLKKLMDNMKSAPLAPNLVKLKTQPFLSKIF